jgi:hypothetical protein
LKASSVQESRPPTAHAVPQQKLGGWEWKDQVRRSAAQPEVKSGWNGTEDPFEIRLPERRDKPWLVMSIAAAFAVICAGFLYSVLK